MRRRDMLKTGAAAVLASVLAPGKAAASPVPSTDALEVLRADYARRVRELAGRLGPRFAEVSCDDDVACEVQAEALQGECKAVLCATEQDARLVFALSPNWDQVDWQLDDHFEDDAATAVALDVAAEAGLAWFIGEYTVRGEITAKRLDGTVWRAG